MLSIGKFADFAKIAMLLAMIVLSQNCGPGFESAKDTSAESSLLSTDVNEGAPVLMQSPEAFSRQSSAIFEFSPGTGGGDLFECKYDDQEWQVCQSPFQLENLSDGEHSLSIREGYVGAPMTSFSWTVDTIPPSIMLQNPPPTINNSTNLQVLFAVEDNFKTKSVSCVADGMPITNCSSPLALDNLGDGSHSLVISVLDEAGNEHQQSLTWTTDITAPTVSLVTMPPAVTTSSEATFSFVGSDGGMEMIEYQCRLNNDSFSACSSPMKFENIAAGDHTFAVTARDQAGNTSAPTIFSWRVNLLPPSFAAPLTDVLTYYPNAINLKAEVAGPATFQWFKDNVLLPGKVANNLMINPAQPTDTGIYKLAATNAAGTVTDEANVQAYSYIGTWARTCNPNLTYKTSSTRIHRMDNTFEMTSIQWSADCTLRGYQRVDRGTFKLSQLVPHKDGREIQHVDWEFTTMTTTPLHPDVVQIFNSRRECGISNWALNQPTNLLNTVCGLKTGYFIHRLGKNGSNQDFLQVGDINSGDGKTPQTRHKELSKEVIFIRSQ